MIMKRTLMALGVFLSLSANAYADKDGAPAYYGLQSTNFSSTTTVAGTDIVSDRSDVGFFAILPADIASLFASLTMNRDLETLNAGITKGVSSHGFYIGAGLGFFMDAYASSNEILYDKIGFTGLVNASYQLKDIGLILNSTYVYRMTGTIADSESSYSLGIGYNF